MTTSFFIPSETKPGKSKIAALLKSVGFTERTSTPLWSYTYTRLRVDQVDFRDDFYDDSDWLYDTEFETKWGVRISLHETHKPQHNMLWRAIALIVSQIYETDELYSNAEGTDVPGGLVEPDLILNWEREPVIATPVVEHQTTEETDRFDELPTNEPLPRQLRPVVVELEEEEQFLPEPEPEPAQPVLVQVAVDTEDDDDDDDWGDYDEDEWADDDDDDDDEESEVEPFDDDGEEIGNPSEDWVKGLDGADDDEDIWNDGDEDVEDGADDEDGNFDGIVTWD